MMNGDSVRMKEWFFEDAKVFGPNDFVVVEVNKAHVKARNSEGHLVVLTHSLKGQHWGKKS